MDWDEPKPKPKAEIGEPLATLSIGELEARIVLLKAEIVRVEAEIAKKRAQQDAASKLFKS